MTDKTETREKMLPCPFCGGEAVLHDGYCETTFYVHCVVCEIGTRYGEKDSVIKIWNSRSAASGDEAKPKFEAMNIVNQILDEVSFWLPKEMQTDFVKFRQQNNDQFDEFVNRVFVAALRSERDQLKEMVAKATRFHFGNDSIFLHQNGGWLVYVNGNYLFDGIGYKRFDTQFDAYEALKSSLPSPYVEQQGK